MPLLIAIILIPLVEIGLFVEVGSAIGLWPTIALVVLSAVAGLALLRAQGFAVMSELRASMERGDDPSGPLAHGGLLLLAGLLLLTPGFFTDVLGLALMIPQLRAALIARAGPHVAARVVRTDGFAWRAGPGGRRGPPGGDGDTPIEADYRDVTDRSAPRRPDAD